MCRVGVIAIVVNNPSSSIQKVNSLLSDFGNIIVGRLDIPYGKRNVHLISLMVDGTTDDIGAFTGKLGMIEDVTVTSNLVKSKATLKEGNE